MKYHYDIVQGTEDWHQIRCGRITKSTIKTLLVKGKSANGLGAGAITNARRIAEERVTNKPMPSFKNGACDWGNSNEAQAREYYEMTMFQKVNQVGFVEKDRYTGCSPDGLINEDGGFEAKCFPVEHIAIIDTGEYRKEEYIDCQVNLWVTERNYWDLFYYHPLYPIKSKAKRFRIEPDKEMHEIFEEKIEIFEGHVKTIIDKLI